MRRNNPEPSMYSWVKSGHWRASGMTISSIKLEPTGTEEDDDYLVFEFGLDPSARKLRRPEIARDATSVRNEPGRPAGGAPASETPPGRLLGCRK